VRKTLMVLAISGLYVCTASALSEESKVKFHQVGEKLSSAAKTLESLAKNAAETQETKNNLQNAAEHLREQASQIKDISKKGALMYRGHVMPIR